jgi:threonine dehydrogenase-like Zn-dependent dehydrogenase
MVTLVQQEGGKAQQASNKQKDISLQVTSATVCGSDQKRWSIDWSKALDLKGAK